jgi:hypothetical protein
MNIDLVQVLTNLIVGAGTAWLTGKFAVRRGLEQSRNQRAFERRIEWYEETFRAYNELMLLIQKGPIPVKSDEFKPAVDALMKCSEKVRSCIDRATVYAKRETLVRMRELIVELDATKNLATGPRIERADLDRKIAAINDVVNRITYELAVSIREDLRLDKIKFEDLSWKRES